EVIKYNRPGRLSLLFKYPHLYDNIHESIEFGSADEKWQKEVVKVWIIENLRKNLKENYGVYMAHYHPAWVSVA
ncbi:7999_t:CDS:2, partial [Racocetra persica]